MVYKKAAGLVAKKGYTNVHTFKAGIPGWVKAGYALDKTGALPKTDIPALKAEQIRAMGRDVSIVDIRVEKLYKMGCIKDSLKIPAGYISQRYSKIPTGKKIVLVDHAGKQSLVVGRFLNQQGYEDVSRLQGGIMAWSRLGFPLEK